MEPLQANVENYESGFTDSEDNNEVPEVIQKQLSEEIVLQLVSEKDRKSTKQHRQTKRQSNSKQEQQETTENKREKHNNNKEVELNSDVKKGQYKKDKDVKIKVNEKQSREREDKSQNGFEEPREVFEEKQENIVTEIYHKNIGSQPKSYLKECKLFRKKHSQVGIKMYSGSNANHDTNIQDKSNFELIDNKDDTKLENDSNDSERKDQTETGPLSLELILQQMLEEVYNNKRKVRFNPKRHSKNDKERDLQEKSNNKEEKSNLKTSKQFDGDISQSKVEPRRERNTSPKSNEKLDNADLFKRKTRSTALQTLPRKRRDKVKKINPGKKQEKETISSADEERKENKKYVFEFVLDEPDKQSQEFITQQKVKDEKTEFEESPVLKPKLDENYNEDPGSKKYLKLNCIICEYQAADKKDLDKHDGVHKNSKGNFKCDFCAHENKLKFNVKQHMVAVHKQSGKTYLKCLICDYQSTSKEDKRIHYLTHRSKTNKDYFTCYICPYEAKLATNLKRHIQAHVRRGRNTLQCSLCGYQADSRKGMDLHNDTLHKGNSKFFKCQFCPFQTVFKSNLKKHVIVVHEMNGWKKLTCVLCDFQAKCYKELKLHDVIVHKKENSVFKCLRCPYEVSCKRKLREHIKYVHDKNGRSKLQCILCNFQGKDRNEFYDHNDREHKTKRGNFKCTFCSFESPRKYLVSVHLRVTHKNKRIPKPKCHLCIYHATSYNDLKVHQRVHINHKVKYYNCKLCSFKSRVEEKLNLHISSEHSKPIDLSKNKFKTNEKKFICYWCGLQTKQKKSIEMHLRRHRLTKETNYQCYVCNYMTPCKFTITNHFSSHSKQEKQ